MDEDHRVREMFDRPEPTARHSSGSDPKVVFLLFGWWLLSEIVFITAIQNPALKERVWSPTGVFFLDFVINAVITVVFFACGITAAIGSFVFGVPLMAVAFPFFLVGALATESPGAAAVVVLIMVASVIVLRHKIAQAFWSLARTPVGTAVILFLDRLVARRRPESSSDRNARTDTTGDDMDDDREKPSDANGNSPPPPKQAEAADQLPEKTAGQRQPKAWRDETLKTPFRPARGAGGVWDSLVTGARFRAEGKMTEAMLAAREHELTARQQEIRNRKQVVDLIRTEYELERLDAEAKREELKLEEEIEERKSRIDELRAKREQASMPQRSRTPLEHARELLKKKIGELPPGSPARDRMVRNLDFGAALDVLSDLERAWGADVFNDPQLRQYLKANDIPVDEIRPPSGE
jgi:hypothetical protein